MWGALRDRFCLVDGELQSYAGQSDLRRGGREVQHLQDEARDGGEHSEVRPVPHPTTVKALCGTRALSVCRLEDVAIHNFALEEKLEELTQSSLNQEDRAARMDQFLNEEELAMKVGSPTTTASCQIKTYFSSSNYMMPFFPSPLLFLEVRGSAAGAPGGAFLPQRRTEHPQDPGEGYYSAGFKQ